MSLLFDGLAGVYPIIENLISCFENKIVNLSKLHETSLCKLIQEIFTGDPASLSFYLIVTKIRLYYAICYR